MHEIRSRVKMKKKRKKEKKRKEKRKKKNLESAQPEEIADISRPRQRVSFLAKWRLIACHYPDLG